jgi:uncharacterized protein (DUF433 family)
MAVGVEIGALIHRESEVRGGRPKIAGTGLTVCRVAGWYKTGATPEEIAVEYPHLSLAQVHAELAYYHANQEEIEADIAYEEPASTAPIRTTSQPPPHPSALDTQSTWRIIAASIKHGFRSGRKQAAGAADGES